MTSNNPASGHVHREVEALTLALREKIRRLEQELSSSRLRIKELEKASSQQELIANGHNYLSVIENMSDVLWTLDTETTRFTYVSPSVERLCGYTPEEVMAGPADNVLMPDVRQSIFELMAQRTAGLRAGHSTSNDFFLQEIEQPCKNGTTVWTETSAHYCLNPRTNKVELHGITREISERKKLEKSLRFRQFSLDIAREEVYWIDKDAHILDVNEAACKGLGYSREEMMKLTVPDIDPYFNFDIWVEHWQELKKNGSLTFESFYKCRDGRISPKEIVANYLEFEGKEYNCALVRDITERKRIENALRENEERLALATLHNGVGIWDWNLQNQDLVWDESMYALYHIHREDFSGTVDAWEKSLHPDDRERGQREIKAALSGEKNFDTEFRVCWPNGDVHHIKAVAKVFRDNNGKPVRMLGTNIDITDRKLMENALRQANAYNRRLIEISLDPLVTISPEGIITDVNAATEAVTGCSREALIGTEFADYFSEPMTARVGYQQAFRTGTVRDYALEIRHLDGHLTPVVYNASAYRDPTGNVVGVFAAARDMSALKQAEAALRESEARLDFALRNSLIGAWEMDMQDHTTRRTPLHDLIYGYETMLPCWTYEMFLEHVLPDDRPRVDRIFHEAAAAKSDWNFEFRIRRADGEVRWIYAAGDHVRNAEGIPQKVSGIVQDITERKRAEATLRLQSLIAANAAEGIVLVGASDGIIQYTNLHFDEMLGYGPGELVGQHVSVINATTDARAQESANTVVQPLSKDGVFKGEVMNRKKDGSTLWTFVHVSTFHDPEKGDLWVCYQSDISEKKKTEELIWQQANFDTLTGLPNRRMVSDRLTQEVKKSHRERKPLALMFIDLDRFKEINDSLGHEMGDILLKETAQRMIGCVREIDTVGRLGGDEFTVILGELDDIGSIERVAYSILTKIAEPYRLGDDLAYTSASIGITLYPNDATDVATLLKYADQAMYAAKRGGRNRCHYYTPAMQEAANLHMRMVNDLHAALRADQFRLHYQPIVELATGSIRKAEALVRWQHPTLGLLSPANFISIAEETGLIVEMSDWVFRQAATEVIRLRDTLHPDFQISVNKSPVQFRLNSDNHAAWMAHLVGLGLPGQSIAVEITESLLMEARDWVNSKLLAFRDSGMEVSLDDFGTGYSSLSYLQKFDIDYIKIDRSFVQHLAHDSNDLALCEAMIVMAHKIGIKVIAEGIETANQRDLLTQIGCDYGQGYLFSRPLPADEFEKLLMVVTGDVKPLTSDGSSPSQQT